MDAPPTPAPLAPVETPKAATIRVPAGTVVEIEVLDTLSSTTSKPGDGFAIKLSSSISVDGKVVVPAGALGRGEIVDAGKAGIGGKPGKLILAARFVEIEGQKILLRGFSLGRAGQDNSGTAMGITMIPYVGVAGIFVTGGNINVTPGTHGLAKIATEFAVAAPAAPTAPPAGDVAIASAPPSN